MHTRLTRIIFILLVIMTFCAGVSFADSGSVIIRLDGSEVTGDIPPVIVNGRTLIPVRSVFEAMGGTVTWDQTTRGVTVNIKEHTIRLKVDSKTAYIDDVEKEIDVPAMIINNRTMIPVRFVSEAVGYKVSWDSVSRVVDIVSVDPETENYIRKEDQVIMDQYELLPVVQAAREKLVVIDPGHGGGIQVQGDLKTVRQF